MNKNLRKYYTLISSIDTKGKHYVYILISPITNHPFYIGKGSGYRYTSHFHEYETGRTLNQIKCQVIESIVKKGLKVLVNIVSIFDTEQEALDKERELIKAYGRLIDSSGLLTNITIGGTSLSGINNPMYGRKRTEEEKQKISTSRKERIASGIITPTQHTEEWKQHLRENNAGGIATSKPVYQICIETGMVLKEWPSAKQASEQIGLSSRTNISSSIKKNNHAIVGVIYGDLLQMKIL